MPIASNGGRKRPRQTAVDSRYPRKRSLRACHVCRARKTKCDNAQPTCGFCASLNIPCSYDGADKDHSSFDAASLEILRQLNQIITSQDDMLHVIRSVANSAPTPSGTTQISNLGGDSCSAVAPVAPSRTITWENTHNTHHALPHHPAEISSAGTTPVASTSVAAVRWFGLLANDASRDASDEAEVPDADADADEDGFLDPSDGQEEADMTPLQRATRMIDNQPDVEIDPSLTPADKTVSVLSPGVAEESLWRASEDIWLLEEEQTWFETFLHRICSWLDLFDPAKTFSTRVPHLAVRNAGLLNAILALSCFHQASDFKQDNPKKHRSTALQYYYQTLHYIQRAMRYPSYQHSQELMATTLIVSTYEMLRGSRRDWQQHLQGVFWILRSRQIEVEKAGLESTTWWAWLRQDIWAAFRERRRTYSTWTPKKMLAELSSHELASRAVWILAQVVNFCALDADGETGSNSGSSSYSSIPGKLAWAEALRKMLLDWRAYLTVEFSPLPAVNREVDEVFTPRLIHPSCFGLAMQVHYVSQILLCAHEPCLGGLETYLERQATIQTSVEMVCGIGMTLNEDASTMLSSQCMFIAGLFMQDPRQRTCLLDMLDGCRERCGWPTPSLRSELEQIWENPGTVWGG